MKVAISLREDLLVAVDQASNTAGTTRSGFFRAAVEARLQLGVTSEVDRYVAVPRRASGRGGGCRRHGQRCSPSCGGALRVRRGEVWWADLPPPAGRRPVVLLSRNEAYAVRELVTVAPVTARTRGIPVEVPLGRDDGLPRDCAANLDRITTVPRSLLRERLAVLSSARLSAIDRAIHFAFGLED